MFLFYHIIFHLKVNQLFITLKSFLKSIFIKYFTGKPVCFNSFFFKIFTQKLNKYLQNPIKMSFMLVFFLLICAKKMKYFYKQGKQQQLFIGI